MQSVPSAASWRLITLNVSVRGSSALMRTNDGHCLGPRSDWVGQEVAEAVDIELGTLGQHQRGHHSVADIGRWYPVHR